MSNSSDIREQIKDFVIAEISGIMSAGGVALGEDSALVGPTAIISSRELVELLLAAEDHMDSAFQVEFDWSSDAAMSSYRSMFRTIGTLTDHLHSLIRGDK